MGIGFSFLLCFSRYMLSVHQGSKVALAACIAQLPLRYLEPEFARVFREARQKWEQSHEKVQVAEGLAYLKTPGGHFLPSIEERQRTKFTSRDDSLEDTSKEQDLASMLESEGLFLEEENADKRRNTDESVESSQARFTSFAADTDTCIKWLVVKYKSNPNLWTFPFTQRRGKESAFNTLLRLCRADIGLDPHFSGKAPVAYRKLSTTDSDSPSTKLFYYRATKVPNGTEVKLPPESPIAVFDWMTRAQLEAQLPLATWTLMRDVLPLD